MKTKQQPNPLLSDFSYDELVIIFVLGMLGDRGLIHCLEGGYWQITDKTRQIYQELKKQGFVPTRPEYKKAIDYLNAFGRG